MNAKNDGRYLIDSYIEEVGHHLPQRQREDIQAEIRSLLVDTLEDRLQETGQEPDVDMVANLLKEFGSPQKMAVSYAADRYLIGPKMFPLFMLVLKIVFSVLIVLGLIGAGIALYSADTPKDGMMIVGKTLLEMLSGLMGTFGSLVIVFAILERVLPDKDILEEDWDPRKLERVPDQDKLKPAELIVTIVFSTIGIIVFNFFPQVIRGISFFDGQMHTFPLLDANFARFIPWLTALWALEILFSIVVLWRRQWEPTTRWIRIGLDVLGMMLLSSMIFGGPLLATSPEAIAAWPNANLVPLAETGLKLALGIALITETVSLIQSLVKQFKKPSPLTRAS